MAFKLTYRDGQADDYDNNTAWAVEDGVLKMGLEADKWTVLVSPSHWATIEVEPDQTSADDDGKKEKEDAGRDDDRTYADSQRDEKDNADKDSDDDDKDGDDA